MEDRRAGPPAVGQLSSLPPSALTRVASFLPVESLCALRLAGSRVLHAAASKVLEENVTLVSWDSLAAVGAMRAHFDLDAGPDDDPDDDDDRVDGPDAAGDPDGGLALTAGKAPLVSKLVKSHLAPVGPGDLARLVDAPQRDRPSGKVVAPVDLCSPISSVVVDGAVPTMLTGGDLQRTLVLVDRKLTEVKRGLETGFGEAVILLLLVDPEVQSSAKLDSSDKTAAAAKAAVAGAVEARPPPPAPPTFGRLRWLSTDAGSPGRRAPGCAQRAGRRPTHDVLRDVGGRPRRGRLRLGRRGRCRRRLDRREARLDHRREGRRARGVRAPAPEGPPKL